MKITKAVIPIAGKGTRFLPATKEIPKEMLPILNRPMIHYVVEEAVNAGIKDVIFITSCGKTTIEDYFDRNFELESFLEKNNKSESAAQIKKIGEMINIVGIRQKEQVGLGNAIACAESVLRGEDFAVLLGDEIMTGSEPVTKQLIEAYECNGQRSVVGVMEIDQEQSNQYGMIDGKFLPQGSNTLRLEKMVEKPAPDQAPSNLATPGRYVLTNDIFDCLKNISPGFNGEIQLTDAINLMASKTEVYAYIFRGGRHDTGNIKGYLDAVLEFALTSPEYSEWAKRIVKEKVSKYNI